MSQHRVVQQLVDRGLKAEDVSRVAREMFSHYESIGLMHQYLPRKGIVVSTGHMKPEIMIVSDRPEEAELQMGFSGFGMYGFYLMLFLNKLGINVSDVYWTQVIKKDVPKIDMSIIKDWYKYLHNEIVVTQPTAIIALGTTSISALAQEPIKIDKAIGEEFFFEMPDRNIPVIPIRHPRATMGVELDEFKSYTGETWRNLKPIEDLLA